MDIYLRKSRIVLLVFSLMMLLSTLKAFSQTTNDSTPPLDFDQLYEKGREYFQKGEYNTSLNYLQQAAIINLNDDVLATYLGITCKELNLYGSAIAYFQNALTIEDSKSYLGNLGGIYGELGQYDLSLEYLNEALSIDPYYSYGLNNKGSLLMQLGQYDEALATLTKAMNNVESPLAQSYSNIGEIYQEMGQSESSMLFFDKAIAADSTLSEAMILKAKELRKLGRPLSEYKSLCDKVIKTESNTLSKNPQAFKSLFFRASAYQYLSENDLMIDDLNRALLILDNLTPLYPEASRLFVRKAEIYNMLGNVEDAIENYRLALDLEPEIISANQYLENR